MCLEKEYESITSIKTSGGFTLVEALLAAFFLGLLASAVSAAYFSGFQSLDEQADRILLDSKLRSRMEALISTDFSALGDSSEVVNINGKDYTITWSVVLVDLNGDSTPEPTARQVTVSVSGFPDRSLTTILVDNEGKVGKIS